MTEATKKNLYETKTNGSKQTKQGYLMIFEMGDLKQNS